MEWSSATKGPEEDRRHDSCRQEKTRLANQPGVKFGRGCLKGLIVVPQHRFVRKCEKNILSCDFCNSRVSSDFGRWYRYHIDVHRAATHNELAVAGGWQASGKSL